MTQQPRQFAFQTEFTPDGEVLSGPGRSYYSRDEAQKLAAGEISLFTSSSVAAPAS